MKATNSCVQQQPSCRPNEIPKKCEPLPDNLSRERNPSCKFIQMAFSSLFRIALSLENGKKSTIDKEKCVLDENLIRICQIIGCDFQEFIFPISELILERSQKITDVKELLDVSLKEAQEKLDKNKDKPDEDECQLQFTRCKSRRNQPLSDNPEIRDIDNALQGFRNSIHHFFRCLYFDNQETCNNEPPFADFMTNSFVDIFNYISTSVETLIMDRDMELTDTVVLNSLNELVSDLCDFIQCNPFKPYSYDSRYCPTQFVGSDAYRRSNGMDSDFYYGNDDLGNGNTLPDGSPIVNEAQRILFNRRVALPISSMKLPSEQPSSLSATATATATTKGNIEFPSEAMTTTAIGKATGASIGYESDPVKWMDGKNYSVQVLAELKPSATSSSVAVSYSPASRIRRDNFKEIIIDNNPPSKSIISVSDLSQIGQWKVSIHSEDKGGVYHIPIKNSDFSKDFRIFKTRITHKKLPVAGKQTGKGTIPTRMDWDVVFNYKRHDDGFQLDVFSILLTKAENVNSDDNNNTPPKSSNVKDLPPVSLKSLKVFYSDPETEKDIRYYQGSWSELVQEIPELLKKKNKIQFFEVDPDGKHADPEPRYRLATEKLPNGKDVTLSGYLRMKNGIKIIVAVSGEDVSLDPHSSQYSFIRYYDHEKPLSYSDNEQDFLRGIPFSQEAKVLATQIGLSRSNGKKEKLNYTYDPPRKIKILNGIFKGKKGTLIRFVLGVPYVLLQNENTPRYFTSRNRFEFLK